MKFCFSIHSSNGKILQTFPHVLFILYVVNDIWLVFMNCKLEPLHLTFVFIAGDSASHCTFVIFKHGGHCNKDGSNCGHTWFHLLLVWDICRNQEGTRYSYESDLSFKLNILDETTISYPLNVHLTVPSIAIEWNSDSRQRCGDLQVPFQPDSRFRLSFNGVSRRFDRGWILVPLLSLQRKICSTFGAVQKLYLHYLL